MRNVLKTLALSLGILGAASIALADSDKSPAGQGAQMPGSMMQGDGMKGNDMSGMDMHKMMQQMGSMMERCDEMMAMKTEHMKSKSAPTETEAPEKKG